MKIFIYILIVVTLIVGCKKYPDDTQKPHLRQPEKRILGNWSLRTVHNYVQNKPSLNFTCGGSPCSIVFGSSNEFQPNYNNTIYFPYKGTWTLIDHKNNLKIKERNSIEHEFKILRLEKGFLNIQDDSLQFFFVPYCGP